MNKFNSILAAIIFSIAAVGAIAQDNCKAERPVDTPSGSLVMLRCMDASGQPTKRILTVAGRKILENSFMTEEDSNSSRTEWVFSGDSSQATGCTENMFFLDLSDKLIRIFKFGVRNACNEFHWASWGKSAAVIALKTNVKFSYKNGLSEI